MAGFIRGDVVVVPFPFSDLSKAKRRPALVLAVLHGDDIILCQITSRKISDTYSITLDESDFEQGSLKQSSNIRPNRIFTADKNIILYKAGFLKQKKTEETIQRIVEILKA